jgi:hypothetical protein
MTRSHLSRAARGAALLVMAGCAAWSWGATTPDAATRRWWSHVRALANDGMEGRDTGSAGHRKAAAYVAARFAAAGLAPAGERGFYQPVPLHAVRFVPERSSVELVRPAGQVVPLRWLRNIVSLPRVGAPEAFDAPLAFTGWETPPEIVSGRILAALAPPRFVPGPRGYAQPPPAGYFATLVIDSASGPEPVRWPSFLSTVMALRDTPLPALQTGRPTGFQFNPADAEALFEGSGHTYAELRARADAGERLPSFAMATRLRGRFAVETRELTSDNVIASLRGSDPVLADEYVVVSAHLDGYGVGEPVNGDRIYNGALDDAAYVATLIDLAEALHASGRRFKRSVLFCVFTAEERGLLGSQYFVAHPTVARARLVADINLDTLRPIFPLRALTTLGLDESTLGATVRRVGGALDIEIRPDRELERGLLRRSDQWSFLQAGIPAVAFVFGYDAGSSDEAVYRQWYAQRYHSPSDDLDQPWDRSAAARFNQFFARLLETVADAAERPALTAQR